MATPRATPQATPVEATVLDAVERALLGVVLEIEAEAAVMLDAEGRNYEGDTKASLYSATRREGTTVVGVVGASSAHAYFAHEGRGPGKPPPYRVIRRWVERKVGLDGPAAHRMTVGIQRSQARRGSRTGSHTGRRGGRGTPFLTRPYEVLRPQIAPRIQAAVAAALNNRV